MRLNKNKKNEASAPWTFSHGSGFMQIPLHRIDEYYEVLKNSY